jgi:putative flippase GtrA
MLFTAVGVVGTAAHFAILVILVQFVAINPVVASMIAFPVAALINYVLNYRLTFRSSNPHHTALPKFLTVSAVGFCLNTLIMAAATVWLHYLSSQVLAALVVLAWNFVCNRIWTFRNDPKVREEN